MTHRPVSIALLLGLAGCPASPDVTALEARIAEAETTIAAQAAQIEDLKARLTTEEGLSTAQATTNTQVQSSFDDHAQRLDGHGDRLDTLESDVTGLGGDVDGLLGDVDNLRTDLDALALAVLDHDALFGYLSVDSSTDSVVFSGANVYIQSGSGSTYGSINGLGNLIVGYDEDDGSDSKSGSHNIVIGPYHTYSNFGGFVGGEDNAITGGISSVFSGTSNLASEGYSVVVGGEANEAGGGLSTVLGGYGNSTVTGYQVVP